MPTLRIDLHVHTRYSDSKASISDVIKKARERGLDGVAVTDHMTLAALKDAPNIVDGFLVIPGVEVETWEGHLLLIGTREVPPKCLRHVEVVRWARQHGCAVVVAHPMALGFRIYQKALLSAKPDAVETLNASVPFESDNLRSIELAKRLGLPQTGGSDSHSADTVGDAYTLVEAEDKTIEAVVRAIREGNVKPAGCRSKPRMRVLRIFSAVIREVLRRLGVFFP